MQNIKNKSTSQNGFTLLEVMIAMVIFAVGMLGLAGIQGLSLENSHSSYTRSQAILLAYDIVDRMKANPEAGTDYEIAVGTNATTPTVYCDVATCTVAQMVVYDHWVWKNALPSLLLSGQGQIENTAGDSYTITVHWDEDRTGVTGTDCTDSVPGSANDLRCFQLVTQL